MTPLVLLHAFPLSSHMWDEAATHISGGRDVIAPDFPGFGNSPREDDFTIAACADAVVTMLDHMRISRAIVCGLSMGGYAALSMWRAYPSRVAGLILADTRAEADSPETRATRASQAETLRRDGSAEFLRAFVPPLIGTTSALKEHGIIDRAMALAGQTSVDGMIDGLHGLASRPDSMELLPTISVPTLIIVGDEDTRTPPECSRLMHKQIPGSVLAIMHGVGHLSAFEDPASFAQIVSEFCTTSQL